MAVATLSNVKTALNLTGTADDALLTQLQDSADSYIEQFCGRTFAGGTFIEFHAGGAQLLFLRNYPLLAVASVRVDAVEEFGPESERHTSSYSVHKDRGVIENHDGPFMPVLAGWHVGRDHFPNTVRVQYTTVENAIPPAVQRAYVELVGHWYRQTKTMQATGYRNIVQENASGTETSYAWGNSIGFALPKGILQLLQPYRAPAM